MRRKRWGEQIMGSASYIGATHLEFKELPLEKNRKTHVYEVINKTFDDKIGIIHWRGGWHQFVFRADSRIDMSRSCHKEIDKFIDELMKKRRDSKKDFANHAKGEKQ